MFLSEGNVLKALKAAPDKKLTYPELLQKFENQIDLCRLLWSMRADPRCPLEFKKGWIDLSEIVVYLED